MRRNRIAAAAVGAALAVCGTGVLAGEASADEGRRVSVKAETSCWNNRVVLKVTVKNESRRDVRGEVRTRFGDRHVEVRGKDSKTVRIFTGQRHIDDGRARFIAGGFERRGHRVTFASYEDDSCKGNGNRYRYHGR